MRKPLDVPALTD